MANVIYPTGLEAILRAFFTSTRPATPVTFKLCAVDDTYVYSAAHNDLTDLGATVISDSPEIDNFTIAGGLVSGDDTTLNFPEVLGGNTIGAFICYAEDNNGDTWLIVFVDEPNGTALPLNTDSETFTVTWPSNQVFSI